MCMTSHPPVQGLPLALLRLEGLAITALSATLYARTGAKWWMFAALWIVPDLGMLGYLADNTWGARFYNLVHTYVAPCTLLLASHFLGADKSIFHPSLRPIPVALVWFNHIAVDRMLGYGLKYPTGFGWTHLGYFGKKENKTA